MRIRRRIILLAAWCLIASQYVSGQGAQTSSQSATAGQLVSQGDAVWINGNPQGALPYYNQAYQLASGARDAQVLTIMAERYLRLGYDSAAVTTYASAVNSAIAWMNSDPYRGQTYRYGFDALNHLINNYNYVITQVPRLMNPDPAKSALLGWAQYASNVVRGASQPAVVPTPQSPPRVGGGTGGLPPCDTSGPNSCDIILTPRNPR
ncbi:MAG: hypothetical protein ABMA15_21810 [Vicinamibacterales bacterium]